MKYTIITINYNNRNGLRRTIESVVNQTYNDFEYIIIDGGSTDGSVDVIKEYANHIDYWVSEPDKGIYNAMNKGILQSHGEYLNFMNSGDCFYNDLVLELISSELTTDIVVGKYQKSDQQFPWHFLYEEVTFLDLYVGTFCHQASFIKKHLFCNTLYDESLKIVSDWKFFLQKLVIENVTFRNSSVIIAKYDATGISSQSEPILQIEKKQYLNELFPKRVLSDYEIFKSLYYYKDLLPELSGSYKFQKFVRCVIILLIKIKRFMK